jgi:nucleoid-associated protein YgaU
MADELDELIQFLGASRADARAQAAEIVQGLTGSDDGIAQLASKAETLIPKLLHLMGAPAAESRPATTALVNLTGASDVATLAVEKGAVERAMQFLRGAGGEENKGCPADLLLGVLVNVTNTEGGVHVFAQEGKSLEGFYVAKLVQMLAEGSPKEKFDRAASVLTNVCRHPAGRRNFLEPSRKLVRATLQSLAPSASETRRVGVAAALRNCCADTPSCESLLKTVGSGNAAAVAAEASVAGFANVGASGATEGGLEVVRALLAPVSGGRDGTGVGKERCDAVRQSCAEAVGCLADCESGRAALVQCDAPRLMRLGYEDEDHGETIEAMETAAEKFLRFGMVPAEMQPADGLRRVEVVDEGEDEVEEIQGGPRPLMTPEVD